MWMGNSIWYLGTCVLILLGCGLAAGSNAQGMENSGFILGNLSADLFPPGSPGGTPDLVIPPCHVIQDTIRAGALKAGPVVPGGQAGWQNVTLPATISSPGNYRVINDYSASGQEIGLTIACSDVQVDGDGHTFNGQPGVESYGLATVSNATLSNIRVTNYNTRGSLGGIVFYGVQGGDDIRNQPY